MLLGLRVLRISIAARFGFNYRTATNSKVYLFFRGYFFYCFRGKLRRLRACPSFKLLTLPFCRLTDSFSRLTVPLCHLTVSFYRLTVPFCRLTVHFCSFTVPFGSLTLPYCHLTVSFSQLTVHFGRLAVYFYLLTLSCRVVPLISGLFTLAFYHLRQLSV